MLPLPLDAVCCCCVWVLLRLVVGAAFGWCRGSEPEGVHCQAPQGCSEDQGQVAAATRSGATSSRASQLPTATSGQHPQPAGCLAAAAAGAGAAAGGGGGAAQPDAAGWARLWSRARPNPKWAVVAAAAANSRRGGRGGRQRRAAASMSAPRPGQVLQLYRAILQAAKRYPSIKRDSVVQEIKREFHAHKVAGGVGRRGVLGGVLAGRAGGACVAGGV